jgi:muramidase (phage lysozyme)
MYYQLQTFLDLIAWSENTDFKNQGQGYNLLINGISSEGTTKYTGKYNSYAKPNTLEKWEKTYIQGDINYNNHPNVYIKWKKGSADDINNFSTAAGRYQILAEVWKNLANKYNINDFTPSSQDKICIALIERSFPFLKLYQWENAISSVCKLFPSFPKAGYVDQSSYSMNQLLNKISQYSQLNKPLSPEAIQFVNQYFISYL